MASKALERVIRMGHVVVKYKVTIDQPEEGSPDYDGIAVQIDSFDEVQAVEVKPLAFGMMFIEVQVVLSEGEGIVDGFEDRVRGVDPLVGQIEALEMGRLCTPLSSGPTESASTRASVPLHRYRAAE